MTYHDWHIGGRGSLFWKILQSWVSLTYETTPKEKVVFFLPTSPLPPPCLSLSLSLSLHGHNIL